MSNYRGEEPAPPYINYQSSEVRLIEPMAAFLIHKELDSNPREGIKNLILRGETDGWKIEFERSNGQILDYDEVVTSMWRDASSENPLHRAYAAIVARSIPIELTGDGR